MLLASSLYDHCRTRLLKFEWAQSYGCQPVSVRTTSHQQPQNTSPFYQQPMGSQPTLCDYSMTYI